MQPVDFTTLTAACCELRSNWLPARLEQVYQRDRHTVALALRTINRRGWLDISWHPQGARLCIGNPPPRTPDTFTFSQQIRHQLGSLALVAIAEVTPWERVIDLQFARRPGEAALWHLYVEIMSKYSNVILTTQDRLIVTCAHQVSAQQSSVRPIQTGQPYELPPSLTDTIPSLSEPLERWQQRISLVPGQLRRNLLKNYRGLSTALVLSMIKAANLDPDRSTSNLTPEDWQQLYQRWQEWLEALEQSKFLPSFTPQGYTVIDWNHSDTPLPPLGNEENLNSKLLGNGENVNSKLLVNEENLNPKLLGNEENLNPKPLGNGENLNSKPLENREHLSPKPLENREHLSPKPLENGENLSPPYQGGLGGLAVKSVQELLNSYYTNELNQQVFAQLNHQLTQKLASLLAKLRLKANTFKDRLQQSDRADDYKMQADLLMANLHQWQPGMKVITLADFETGEPVAIPLEPEKNAVQNAQSLYKRHQKLKRARIAVNPLLAAVQEEIDYLEQVEAALSHLEGYRNPEDLQTLEEIREELIQQKYLEDANNRLRSLQEARNAKEVGPDFHRYQTPNGFELLIGRNNRQNDLLTFRIAGDYDLWFHTQEIPGSHGLLRLEPGTAAEEVDLQFAANLAAYYSRARQSEQVPVVYTEPKYVYKPKGAKPGMVVYKQERIIWGRPQQVLALVQTA
ncbi:MAG TPA: NFACT RNA binding domain-containing protein [Kamptonema sp.]|nr:NFACT RNA binding domain-containing protein [Kamptonema sp.]